MPYPLQWHVSIKVMPDCIALGKWLKQYGLPVLQVRPWEPLRGHSAVPATCARVVRSKPPLSPPCPQFPRLHWQISAVAIGLTHCTTNFNLSRRCSRCCSLTSTPHTSRYARRYIVIRPLAHLHCHPHSTLVHLGPSLRPHPQGKPRKQGARRRGSRAGSEPGSDSDSQSDSDDDRRPRKRRPPPAPAAAPLPPLAPARRPSTSEQQPHPQAEPAPALPPRPPSTSPTTSATTAATANPNQQAAGRFGHTPTDSGAKPPPPPPLPPLLTTISALHRAGSATTSPSLLPVNASAPALPDAPLSAPSGPLFPFLPTPLPPPPPPPPPPPLASAPDIDPAALLHGADGAVACWGVPPKSNSAVPPADTACQASAGPGPAGGAAANSGTAGAGSAACLTYPSLDPDAVTALLDELFPTGPHAAPPPDALPPPPPLAADAAAAAAEALGLQPQPHCAPCDVGREAHGFRGAAVNLWGQQDQAPAPEGFPGVISPVYRALPPQQQHQQQHHHQQPCPPPGSPLDAVCFYRSSSTGAVGLHLLPTGRPSSVGSGLAAGPPYAGSGELASPVVAAPAPAPTPTAARLPTPPPDLDELDGLLLGMPPAPALAVGARSAMDDTPREWHGNGAHAHHYQLQLQQQQGLSGPHGRQYAGGTPTGSSGQAHACQFGPRQSDPGLWPELGYPPRNMHSASPWAPDHQQQRQQQQQQQQQQQHQHYQQQQQDRRGPAANTATGPGAAAYAVSAPRASPRPAGGQQAPAEAWTLSPLSWGGSAAERSLLHDLGSPTPVQARRHASYEHRLQEQQQEEEEARKQQWAHHEQQQLMSNVHDDAGRVAAQHSWGLTSSAGAPHADNHDAWQ